VHSEVLQAKTFHQTAPIKSSYLVPPQEIDSLINRETVVGDRYAPPTQAEIDTEDDGAVYAPLQS
jgi:hypothetical protein